MVDIIRFALYSVEGEEEAAKKGRMLWYDDEVRMLTIVDSKDRIDRITPIIDTFRRRQTTGARPDGC